jgi:hypothetical protein
MLTQLASALDYAHANNVVHRDIKPSNIMFDEQGSAILVDFGIAKFLDANTSITMENQTFGTPHYMPPEQWRDQALSAKTDQYALAVVIYSLITGKPPFDAPTPHALMYKHLEEAPPSPQTLRADLPAGLTAIMRKALSKKPEQRYDTVTDFAAAFTDEVSGLTSAPNGFFTFELPTQTVATQPSVAMPPVSKPPPPKPAAPTVFNRDADSRRETAMRAPVTVQNLPPVPAPPPPPPSAIHQTAPQSAAMQRPPQPQPQESGGCIPPLLIGGSIGVILLVSVAIVIIGLIGWQLGWFESDEPAAVAETVTDNDDDENETDNGANPAVIGAPPTSPPQSAAPTVIELQPVAPRGAQIAAANVSSLTETIILEHGTEPVRAVDFSPDGRLLATGAGDGSIHIWDATTGVEQRVITSGGGVAYGVAFSPDVTQIVGGYEDGSVRLWDVGSGRQIAQFSGHTAAVRGVAFSPDGARILSGSEDETARVWDVQSRTATTLEGHEHRVIGVGFSPDGESVATASDDGTARLWDPDNGIETLQLSSGGTELRAAAFSPDGRLLATPATDGSVRIWNLDTGEQIHALRGHTGWIWYATFSPDGTLLATGGRDETVRLWDVGAGTLIETLRGHAGWVLGVDFNPNGGALATGGGDGTARVWEIR